MDETNLLQLVVTLWQVRFQATQHHLWHWHTALLPCLAAIDTQSAFVAIERIDRQPRQLAAARLLARGACHDAVGNDFREVQSVNSFS